MKYNIVKTEYLKREQVFFTEAANELEAFDNFYNNLNTVGIGDYYISEDVSGEYTIISETHKDFQDEDKL